MERLPESFYARPVVEVAQELIGCVLRNGDTAGVIVETEAYHQSEPACHGYGGITPRSSVLFQNPGTAYVYRSYGIHNLFNAVVEQEGVGAAVLVRALEPLEGVDLMFERRQVKRREDLCSGPGKLAQALNIGLDLNQSSLIDGKVGVEQPPGEFRRDRVKLLVGPRIGISKAVELPWRFALANSRYLSSPSGKAAWISAGS